MPSNPQATTLTVNNEKGVTYIVRTHQPQPDVRDRDEQLCMADRNEKERLMQMFNNLVHNCARINFGTID